VNPFQDKLAVDTNDVSYAGIDPSRDRLVERGQTEQQ
jgi:hypothetical protein